MSHSNASPHDAAVLQRAAADTRLTLEAKGILFYILTRPAGFELAAPDLMALADGSRRKSGKYVVYACIKDLIELGYLSRRKLWTGATVYTIHGTPHPLFDGDAAAHVDQAEA